jgi:hypothetical protein
MSARSRNAKRELAGIVRTPRSCAISSGALPSAGRVGDGERIYASPPLVCCIRVIGDLSDVTQIDATHFASRKRKNPMSLAARQPSIASKIAAARRGGATQNSGIMRLLMWDPYFQRKTA